MNQVVLIGNLTKDPEIRNNGNGTVCRFSIAVNGMKKKDGTQEVDYIPIVCFGKTAEIWQRFIHKGSKVAVGGRIKTGSYTNKEGQKVYTTDIIASTVEFLSPKKESNPPAQHSGFGQADPGAFGMTEEDMPSFM